MFHDYSAFSTTFRWMDGEQRQHFTFKSNMSSTLVIHYFLRFPHSRLFTSVPHLEIGPKVCGDILKGFYLGVSSMTLHIILMEHLHIKTASSEFSLF